MPTTSNDFCDADFGIVNWAIVFGGFGQIIGHPSGSFGLWRKVHARHAGKLFRAEFRAWNDDVNEIANLIFHASRREFAPTVNIAGFSWGGMAAANLCRRLDDRGIEVDRVVLCDPVFRHRYFAGNWRAFFPYATIRIPANVRRVDWYHQRVDWPCGHHVAADDPDLTLIAAGVELRRRHVWMDDSPEYHAAFLSAVDGQIE